MTITQQQNLLQYLGYYDGRVDGISGPLTEAAVAAFRTDNGMPALGDELEEVLIGAVFYGRLKGSAEPPKADESTDFWSTVKYFGKHEFACKCGGKYCNGYPVEPSEALVRVLDQIRERTGEPVYINSGIRCKQHNAAVGGAPQSRHLYGDAADIRSDVMTPRELYSIAESLLPNTGGIGIYSWGIHVDMRDTKARW